MAAGVRPVHSEQLFACMMRDITTGGGNVDGVEQVRKGSLGLHDARHHHWRGQCTRRWAIYKTHF
jgi:hypothetical protein